MSRTSGDGTTSGTYDVQDRLLTYGNVSYQYNAAEQLTKKIEPGGTTTYGYDELGNLTAIGLPDGTQVEYLIDGRNRRVGKKVNGVLVEGFAYENQLRPVAETDGAGNAVARFVYGDRVNVPDYITKGEATYRIITDHLGSPRLIVDASTGEVAQRMNYDEFGQLVLDTSPGLQPFGFSGGVFDSHKSLTRLGTRDYEPSTAAWLSRDATRFARRQFQSTFISER